MLCQIPVVDQLPNYTQLGQFWTFIEESESVFQNMLSKEKSNVCQPILEVAYSKPQNIFIITS